MEVFCSTGWNLIKSAHCSHSNPFCRGSFAIFIDLFFSKFPQTLLDWNILFFVKSHALYILIVLYILIAVSYYISWSQFNYNFHNLLLMNILFYVLYYSAKWNCCEVNYCAGFLKLKMRENAFAAKLVYRICCVITG